MTGINQVAIRVLKKHRHPADSVFLPIAEREVREILEHFKEAGFGAYRISSLLTEIDKPTGEAA